MAKSRLIGDYPVIGIRPTIDGRRGALGVRESLEDQTMNMAKSADIRPGITLACTECKERNYITTKNRRNTPDRLELKKFCARCGKQTVHRETR